MHPEDSNKSHNQDMETLNEKAQVSGRSRGQSRAARRMDWAPTGQKDATTTNAEHLNTPSDALELPTNLYEKVVEGSHDTNNHPHDMGAPGLTNLPSNQLATMNQAPSEINTGLASLQKAASANLQAPHITMPNLNGMAPGPSGSLHGRSVDCILLTALDG